MKLNMGSADRWIRGGIAVVIGVLIITHVLSGVLAWILGIFAVIFLITAFTGVCPGYFPFHISTLKKTDEKTE